MLPGGSTDKFGNYYEGLCTVNIICDILANGEGIIRLEPINSFDSKGVEFYTIEGDIRTYYQVKYQNGKDGHYTLAKLKELEILKNFLEKLKNSENVRCIFISSDSAFQLEKLIQRKNASINFNEFKSSALSDKNSKKWFDLLVDIWKVSEETCYVYLGKISVKTCDLETLKEILNAKLSSIIIGNVLNCQDVLSQYIFENINQELNEKKIWNHLEKRDFKYLDINKNIKLLKTWNNYKELQLKKLEHYLICDEYIEREEVIEIHNKMKQNKIVLLSGSANSGKSTILYDFIKKYDNKEYEIYMLRLDSLSHIKSIVELKEHLDLPETPEKILSNISKNKFGILVIDQLDAISIYSGRNGATYDNVIFSIIENVKKFDNLKVLISCRSVDLKNDYRFRKMIDEEKNNVVEVSLIIKKDVLDILDKLKVNIQDELEIELLRNPLNLYLLSELVIYGEIDTYHNIKELYNKYWEWKKRNFIQVYDEATWNIVLEKIINFMSENGKVSIPYMKLDKYKNSVQKMITENILKEIDKSISFFHESFFDYAFARIFFQGENSIHEFIIKSDQYLFRRAQIRQLLLFYREEDKKQYAMELKKIIEDRNIRYHLKDVVFKMLNSVDNPEIIEYKLIEKYLKNEKSEFFTQCWDIVFNEKWAIFIIENQLIEEFFINNKEEKIKIKIKILELITCYNKNLTEREFELIEEFYKTYLGTKDTITRNILNFNISISEMHYNFYKKMLEEGIFDDYLNTSLFIRQIENIDLLEMIFTYLSKKYPEENCFKKLNFSITNDMKINFLKKRKLEFISKLDNFFEKTKYIEKYGVPFTGYKVFPSSYDLEESIFDVFIECLLEESKENLEIVLNYIEKYEKKDIVNYYHFVFEILKRGSEYLYDKALDFIIEFMENISSNSKISRFEVYEYVKNNSEYWTLDQVQRLEYFLDYYSKYEKPRLINWYGKNIGLYNLGKTQFYIFSGLDNLKMTLKIKKRFYELKRKFLIVETSTSEVIHIPPPILKDKALLMKEAHWIKAIKKYSSLKYLKENEWTSMKVDIHSLAWMLREFAKDEPEKYYKILLKIYKLEDINKDFINYIVEGISDSTFLDDKLTNEIIGKIYVDPKEDVSRSLATLIINNPKINYTRKSMDIIKDITLNNPSPELDHWKAEENNGRVYYGGDSYSAGINSIRGNMARAIGMLLSVNNTREYLEKNLDFAKEILNDKTTAVKSCCIDIIIVYYNFYDQKIAINMLRKLIETSYEEILGTHDINHFLWYVFLENLEEFRDILNTMLNSNYEKVLKNGVLHVGKLLLLGKNVNEEFKYSINRNKQIIEEAFSQVFCGNIVKYQEICEKYLLQLSNSEIKETRREIIMVFYKIINEEIEKYKDFILKYISTNSFKENYSQIIYKLKEIKTFNIKIPNFIFEFIEEFLKVKFINEIDYYSMGEIFEIIYIIYEEASFNEQEKITKCLDLIDQIFRISPYRMENKILKKIERIEC